VVARTSETGDNKESKAIFKVMANKQKNENKSLNILRTMVRSPRFAQASRSSNSPRLLHSHKEKPQLEKKKKVKSHSSSKVECLYRP
jgi:hypothetical protein